MSQTAIYWWHCFLNIRGSNFRKFVNFLAEVKQGQVGGIKVRLDRLQALISTSCIEHLEFGRDEDADRQLQHRLMYVLYDWHGVWTGQTALIHGHASAKHHCVGFKTHVTRNGEESVERTSFYSTLNVCITGAFEGKECITYIEYSGSIKSNAGRFSFMWMHSRYMHFVSILQMMYKVVGVCKNDHNMLLLIS